MLSGITFGSKKELEKQFREESQLEQAKKREQRRKEKKEIKKHKKEKHKKSRRKHESSGSDSEGSSGPEDAWLQQQQGGADSPGSPTDGDRPSQPPALQREDWMTVPMARSFAGQPEQKQAEKPQEKEPEEAPVVGGIRYMKPEQAAAAAAREEERRKAAAAAGPAATGLGGAAAGVSWRVKALARAQQLAKEQGKGLNEVLSERWGSAAEIAKGIMDNAAAAEQQQQQQRPDRQQQHRDGGGPVPHYLSDVRSQRGSMMRPPSLAPGAGSSKLSWRRPAAEGGGSSREADRDRERDRDRGREQERDRERGSDRDRGRDREQDRDRDMDRGGGRESGPDRQRDRDREQQGDREPRRHGSAREQQQQQQHERDRERRGDGGGGSDDRRTREGGREREQGRGDRRDWDSRGGRDGRRQQEPQQQQRPREVVEALKAVAGSINTFSNDGSFMQQFNQQQDQPQQQQQHDRQQQRRLASPPRSMERDKPEQQQQQLSRQPPDHGGEAGAPDGDAAAADNRSKADLLRARLGGKPAGAAGAGNRSAADALRARLGGKAPPAAAAAAAGPEVVHLPLVDAAGRAAPGAFGRETAADSQRALEAAAGGRVAKRVQRYGEGGTRERYFADDDSTDLQTLVKRAKHGDTGMDIDRTLAANIAKRQRFKETDLDPDAEYDHDAGVDMSDSRRRRGDVEQQAARERSRQVAAFNRLQRMEDKCGLCFKSPARNQDLTIAVGQSSYLALMQRGKLVQGHCCIVTQEHTPSMRQVDDDTWNEVRNWQKCVINMFLAEGKQVIFLETAMAVGSHRHHAMMEAVPVDEQVLAKAPMYYKKAMEEAESEWSQHAAKAAIPTRDKGLRGSIPPNFPYLYVQFGPSNGYVHVIDDEAKFDRNLGRQVLVGLLRLPAEVMHRRGAALDAGTVKREAAAFRQRFSPFF